MASQGQGAAPTGWPAALPPPASDDFGEAVVGWLLDVCPPEYRRHLVLRRHPVVLARFATHHVSASLAGARAAYAGARRELGDLVGADVVSAALLALEQEGARLAALEREVGLVEEALRGRRWAPKL